MYIRSIADLLEVLTLQKQNLSTYQTEVGATAQDLTDVTEDFANVTYLVNYSTVVD